MSEYHYDWDAVRAMYEAGEAITAIAAKPHMPSKQSIHKRLVNERWERLNETEGELIPFDGLTDKQRIVVKEVSRGMPQKWAAAIAGVHETTVSDWKKLNPNFANALLAATGVFARGQLRKVTEASDWRSGMAILERHQATRDDFAPANAQKMVGTTFNVLGHVNVGFDREAAPEAPLLENTQVG